MLTVYSTQHCTQCKTTKSILDKWEVKYDEIDLQLDPRGASVLQKYPAFGAAPIVVVQYPNGEEDAWCGFRSDKLKAYADAAKSVEAGALA